MFKVIKKIYLHLNKKQKNNFFYIGFLSFVYIFLESVTMTLLLPFFSIVLEQKNSFYFFAEKTSIFFGFDNLLNFSILVILISFILKNILLIFFYYILNKNIAIFQTETSKNLLSGNFYKNYEELLSSNSSKLIRNITISSSNLSVFAKDFIVLSLNIFLIILFVILLVVSSKESLILIASLTLTSGAVIIISKKFIYSLGKQSLDFSERWLKKLKDSSKAIKQIKMMKLENHFLKDFTQDNNAYNIIQSARNTIAIVPKSIIEIVSIVIICALIYFSSEIKAFNKADLLISLAFFGAILSRVIPLLNNCLTVWSNLTFLAPTCQDIIESSSNNNFEEEELDFLQNNIKKKFTEITFKNVDYKYPGAEDFIFKNINLEIPIKKFIGITGNSGCGKSTFLDLICGLLSPNSGSVKVDNVPVNDKQIIFFNHLGYASQEVIVLDANIKENIFFGRDAKGKLDSETKEKMLRDAVKEACLEEFIDSLPQKFYTRAGEDGSLLSGGQRQRISLARAILLKPSILILDEATSALDKKTENKLMNNLLNNKSFKTVFICSHNHENLKYCDVLIEIKDKKISIIK